MPATRKSTSTPNTTEERAAPRTRSTARPRRKGAAVTATKLFVLDTNVLMHDPTSLYRFEEHDLYVPIMTLEELDNNKKGTTEVARNTRQASRMLDEIVSSSDKGIETGIALEGPSRGQATGRMYLQTEAIDIKLPPALPTARGDNQILAVVMYLAEKHPAREVILVSKDINMRIKARALGLAAQDYFNDKVLEDSDLLYAGTRELPADFWDTHGRGMQSWKEEGHTYYRLSGPLAAEMLVNEFVYQDGDTPLQAWVKEKEGRSVVLETLTDFSHQKNNVWGITARNREQNFALNLLMNPEIDFVTLLGQAGTGKTLLTLAAGLTQVLESKRYSEIIMTRVTVSVGEDIGFLPGTEEEKMAPWMGALEDNLEVLNGTAGEGGDWGRAATRDLIRSRIKIKSLNFMRGRTFLNKFLIIDEAQNLTPKQMKTLITRAGPGTKVICMGNIAQIDTPYLTEGSSGLTFVVDRFKGWAHSGHITLQRGERSRLADYAAEVL
ncbi:PhoH family protein [Thauera sp.]|jgi:PhoH-like ATPase|uniref:PhoH family protein n=1 Tax=Thauera sp. TaxID=1905334 RepID=UPI002A36F433|nr:PhoH family protein [Thauera sp.]MDX9885249.1 PhoH family protein [Thauera sp.]